jgi:hypothetical protein
VDVEYYSISDDNIKILEEMVLLEKWFIS